MATADNSRLPDMTSCISLGGQDGAIPASQDRSAVASPSSPSSGSRPEAAAAYREARAKAWETRRAKYGPRGHGSPYRTSPLRQSEATFKVELARQNISQARRQCQIMLPDRAAHIAISRLDIADKLLCEAFLPTFSEPRDSVSHAERQDPEEGLGPEDGRAADEIGIAQKVQP